MAAPGPAHDGPGHEAGVAAPPVMLGAAAVLRGLVGAEEAVPVGAEEAVPVEEVPVGAAARATG